MEFLELNDIRANKNKIFNAYEDLLDKIPGIRRKSKQWQFLDLCFRRTILGEGQLSDDLESNANYYKFEVQNILDRYYSKGFQPIEFVFALKHKNDVNQLGFNLFEENYPSTFGYCLLVRSLKPEENVGFKTASVKEYLMKIVSEGIKAEFDAYKKLPEINPNPLLHWFHEGGSAFNEIMSTLIRTQKKGWVLTNDFNPSHQYIKSIKVAELEKDNALVRTIEYDYLKWFDTKKDDYTYVYRETASQTYQLTCVDGIWLIEATLRRLPLTSLPRRYEDYKEQ